MYSQWQQERLFKRASQSLRAGNVPLSAISLRRVLNLNPNHVAATRAMAELAETYLPREAPALRERVCELAPDSYADARAWALTALKLGYTAQAEDALELMKKTSQPNVAFYEVGGQIAVEFGRLEEARGQFIKALELDPANESNQLQLATVEIRLPDPTVRAAAREKLERLRENPQLCLGAIRALVRDRIEQGMISEALVLANEFVKGQGTTFQDRLQYLALLRAKEDPAFQFTTSFNPKDGISFGVLPESQGLTFSAYLNDLQAEAQGDAGNVASLLTFLNSRSLSLLACEWTSTMPREFVSVPPVAPLLADAYRLTLDWKRLEELVAKGEWGEMEFMRFAFFSRVLQAKGDRAGALAHWATAIKRAEYRYERLATLARSASAWGWTDQFEEILWINARNSKRPRQALEELVRLYQEKRDSQKLLTVLSRLLEIEPKDVTVRKSWARLSHLLGDDRFRAGNIAQQLYKEHPADPEIAATYAMILEHRRQDAEALAAMNRLSPEQLRMPSIAGYYGIVLGANNRKEEAVEYLALAADASLLQEEVALMDQTRRSLGVNTLRR